jgi:ABC-type transport system involved in multi-copper enzyme maturation permease subunit
VIWRIAKKDFLVNLMTFKFAVGTILCVVLMAVFTSILLKDYQQRLDNYNQAVADDAAELRKARVYKNVRPIVYRPPEILSIFSEGFEKRFGNAVRIELDNVPEIESKHAEKNPLLVIFPTLDISLVFGIVLSILALLIAYDTVSGERERETLKLMLSGTATRHQVLTGKLVAGLTTLAIPVTMAFIVAALILCLSPHVNLRGSDWAALTMMYIVLLICISALYNIGLLCSCLTKRSTTSLMFALLSWIILVMLIPNISVSLAREFCVPEPPEKREGQVAALEAEFDRKYNEFKRTLPPRIGDEFYGSGIYGQWYLGGSTREGVQRFKRLLAFGDPLREKYAEKVWKVRREYFRNLAHQKDFADNISRCSPISSYGQIMCVLSRTDLDSLQDFIGQAVTYRNAISEYIRSKTNNFSSISYFSPLSEEDIDEFMRLNQDFEEAVARLKKESGDDSVIGFLTEYHEPLKRFREKIVGRSQPLDLSDLPGFAYKSRNIVNSVRNCLFDVVILVLTNVLFFSLSFLAFVRYDVR